MDVMGLPGGCKVCINNELHDRFDAELILRDVDCRTYFKGC